MPIPFMLAGVALLAGGLGLKKGYDAYSDNEEAEGLVLEAKELFDEAKADLEHAREQCIEQLNSLGVLKLKVWNEQLGRFLALVERVKNIDVTGTASNDIGKGVQMNSEELLSIKQISLNAAEIVAGGVQALGAGALAGVGAYGGAMMFASASTGAAISTLSGVAATNATLAWFGGGSLAAGGLGMAGGTAVLGGLVAGPVLAIGGIFLAAKARENLAEAKKTMAKAEQASEEMRGATSVLLAIKKIAGQFYHVIENADFRMIRVLDQLERDLDSAEKTLEGSLIFRIKRFLYKLMGKKLTFNYKDLTLEQKHSLHSAYQFAQVLKTLLETPLLNKEGSLDKNCIIALEHSKKSIRGLGE